MGAQEQGHGPNLAHNRAVLIGPEDQPRPQAVFIFPHPESSYSSYQDRGTRDQIANINWVIEKAREFQKNIFCLNDYTKAFDCVEHNKLWKILKEIRIADHLTWLLRNTYVGQKETEPDMEQCTGLNLKRSMSRLYIITLLISVICSIHHVKCQAGRSTIWNQDCREKYQQPQICRWYHSNGR